MIPLHARGTGLTRFSDEHGEIEIDLRYTPLYLCRWRGRLSHSIVTELFAFSAEIAELSVALERNGQRIAMVGSWQIIAIR